MKRISLILASLVLVFGTGKASAFSGGPFGNGDYSELLDNSGVYQVAFRFSNGSGFAQFGNNVNPELFLPTGNANTGGAASTTFSTLNRSILYYKGVTYLGTCTGMVDHERKIVSGVTNGSSDITTSQTTTAPGGGTAVTAANTLIFNGLGFPANTEFLCKITKTYPVLRFNGKGELTILNPSLAQISFTALQNFAADIDVSNTAGGGTTTSGGGVTTSPTIAQQIQNLTAGLTALQTGGADLIPSAEQTKRNSDHVPMIVFGSRIFFVGAR
jgi:hypothetical protein